MMKLFLSLFFLLLLGAGCQSQVIKDEKNASLKGRKMVWQGSYQVEFPSNEELEFAGFVNRVYSPAFLTEKKCKQWISEQNVQEQYKKEYKCNKVEYASDFYLPRQITKFDESYKGIVLDERFCFNELKDAKGLFKARTEDMECLRNCSAEIDDSCDSVTKPEVDIPNYSDLLLGKNDFICFTEVEYSCSKGECVRTKPYFYYTYKRVGRINDYNDSDHGRVRGEYSRCDKKSCDSYIVIENGLGPIRLSDPSNPAFNFTIDENYGDFIEFVTFVTSGLIKSGNCKLKDQDLSTEYTVDLRADKTISLAINGKNVEQSLVIDVLEIRKENDDVSITCKKGKTVCPLGLCMSSKYQFPKRGSDVVRVKCP